MRVSLKISQHQLENAALHFIWPKVSTRLICGNLLQRMSNICLKIDRNPISRSASLELRVEKSSPKSVCDLWIIGWVGARKLGNWWSLTSREFDFRTRRKGESLFSRNSSVTECCCSNCSGCSTKGRIREGRCVDWNLRSQGQRSANDLKGSYCCSATCQGSKKETFPLQSH